MYTERDAEIANEIYRQLGGNRFKVMTGAEIEDIVHNGIVIHLKRNASSANRMTITLNASDLYDMRFTKYTKPTLKNDFQSKEKEITSFNDIYFDQLQEVFTQVTGMYTRLF